MSRSMKLQMGSGILMRCPLKDRVPDFPCPGHYKHEEVRPISGKMYPCGQGEKLCSLSVFTNILFSSTTSKLEEDNNGCSTGDCNACRSIQGRLKKVLCSASQFADKILLLGNTIRTDNIVRVKELSDVLSLVESTFAETSVQVLPCIGDQEAAIRCHYMKSPLATFFREYGLIKQEYRCCGAAYYSTRIGPEGVLVVLDGYELLVPDFDCASEFHGTSVNVDVPTGVHMGDKCISCETKSGNTPEVGWYKELQPERHSIHPVDLKRLPPIRNAISEQQLQWLNRQLQEATRNADNVIIACHAPLHPLLVRDQAALPINWKQILRLLLQFACVRCVLQGRPMSEAAHPPDPKKPFQMDHDILYYSLPPAWMASRIGEPTIRNMIVEIGYDFIRIKGNGIPMPPENEMQSQWTILFEPRRKLSDNRGSIVNSPN